MPQESGSFFKKINVHNFKIKRYLLFFVKVTIFRTLPKRVNIWNRNKEKKQIRRVLNRTVVQPSTWLRIYDYIVATTITGQHNWPSSCISLVTISTTTEGAKQASLGKEGTSPHDRSKLVLGTGDCQGCVPRQILAFAIINSIVWPTQSAICMIMTAIRGRWLSTRGVHAT